MSVHTRVLRLLADPVLARYTVQGKVAPRSLWSRYARTCRQVGLRRGRMLLSLDCDTTRDVEVAIDVHGRLVDRGVTPVYAVPGALLEQGADVYAKIASSGAEFMNHGYAEHTRLHAETGTYESLFFYDELPPETVTADIVRGDRAVREILGVAPRGFRTPHFGSFQKPEHLRLLYATLDGLGYEYSTSTSPLAAFRRGPWHRVGSLVEIPVTGAPSWPLGILDSFGFRFAPGRTVQALDYLREVRRLRQMLDEGIPLVVNLYADPSQVEDWPEFFDAIGEFAAYAVPTYADLYAEPVP